MTTTKQKQAGAQKLDKKVLGDHRRYDAKRKLGIGDKIENVRLGAQKLLAIDYHRNGISGLGFHAAIVEDKEDGQTRNMLVVRFPKEDADEETGQVVCAAFDIAKLATGDIRFFFNSWRGDHYHDLIDNFLASEEKKAAAATATEGEGVI